MCIYIYIYTYIHIHLYMCVYMCIYIYIYIHTYIHIFTLLDLCVSSLRRGHANLLCIVPILTDDPRRESLYTHIYIYIYIYTCCFVE